MSIRILALIIGAPETELPKLRQLLEAPELRHVLLTELVPAQKPWWQEPVPFVCRAIREDVPTALYWSPGGQVRIQAKVTWPVKVFEWRPDGWLRVTEDGQYWMKAEDLKPSTEA